MDDVDVILFSGDAYVDHPSFGAAVIGRILEAEGTGWRLFPNRTGTVISAISRTWSAALCSVCSRLHGSMVNKYTANRRLRSEDAYSPDGRHDLRPEYPTIVYSQILKQLYPDVPVILGDRSLSTPPDAL